MRLYLFENGVYKPTGDPFPGFLIQDGKHNILIDTGITPADAEAINRGNGDDGVEVGPSRLPAAILADMSLRPEDIDVVINTHFHYDHCGYNRLFRLATFYVQKSHYDYARSSRDPSFGLTLRHWDDPSIAYRCVEGDAEILEGIRVVKTDGHVKGIQSVVVKLENTGNVLIASDAMRDSRMLDADDPAAFSMFDADADLVNEGVRELKRIIREMDVRLIVFNHDGKVWPTYRKYPDFYD